jgi:predicted nucleic acid-binding protein
MTVLVDSDILIEISRNKDAALRERWMRLSDSEDMLLCSPVSVAELWQGARPSEYEALTNLFHTLICVPVDAEAGRQAGEYLREYRKSHNVELADALIAAAVVLQRASLWTRNRKYYPMKGLTFY